MASFPCPHCNLVYYGKSPLTRHINDEHWREVQEQDTSLGTKDFPTYEESKTKNGGMISVRKRR